MFKKDWPKMHAAWASVALKTYEEYVQTISKVLAEESKRLDRRVKKELKSLNDDDKFERERWYYDQVADLKNTFPSMCYRTTFVAVYSRLEHELVSWCHKLQSIQKHELSVEDLGGRNTIDRCRTYMVKVARIKFPDKSPEWQEITTKLQRIRNKIVHERGQLLKRGQSDTEETKEIRKYIKAKGGNASTLGSIQLTEKFCLHSVDVVRRFIKTLADVTPDT